MSYIPQPKPSLVREPPVPKEVLYGSYSYFPKNYQAGSGFGLTINTASCNRQTWEAPPKQARAVWIRVADEVTLDSLPESHLAAAAGAPETSNLSARAV